MTNDARLYAPATDRNREAILEVLLQVLPPQGTILEIASGTGEHAVFFAPRLSPRQWLPSEPNPQSRASITAWSNQFRADNLYPPLELNAAAPVWPIETRESPKWLSNFDFNASPLVAIVNINMIHISPWSTCLGLMAGAGRILPSGGILYLYGPFKRHGEHTSESNANFDSSLCYQNPEWGVRNLEEVVEVAKGQKLNLLKTYQMPANNLSVVFQRE
ncbi:MAG: DUF938 domain-containing protein [Coleofasciculaceae cyanobacterium]